MEHQNKTTAPINEVKSQDSDNEDDEKYDKNINSLYQNHLLCYAHDENMSPNQVKEYIKQIISKIQGESYSDDVTMKLFAQFLGSPEYEEFYLSKDENNFRLVFADNNHNDEWPVLLLQDLLKIFQTMEVDVPKFCEYSILKPGELDKRCSKEKDSNLNLTFIKYSETENKQIEKGLNQQFIEAETRKFIETIEKMFPDNKDFENQIKILRILSGNFEMAMNIKRDLKKKEKFDFIIFCGSKHSQGISHLLKGKSALMSKNFIDFDSSSVDLIIKGYNEDRGINTFLVENPSVKKVSVIQNSFDSSLKDAYTKVFNLFPKSQVAEKFLNSNHDKFNQNSPKPKMTKDERVKLQQTIVEILNSFSLLPYGYNWESFSLLRFSRKPEDKQFQFKFEGFLSIKKTKPMTYQYFFEIQIIEKEQSDNTNLNLYEFYLFYPKKNWEAKIDKQLQPGIYDELLKIHNNYF